MKTTLNLQLKQTALSIHSLLPSMANRKFNTAHIGKALLLGASLAATSVTAKHGTGNILVNMMPLLAYRKHWWI